MQDSSEPKPNNSIIAVKNVIGEIRAEAKKSLRNNSELTTDDEFERGYNACLKWLLRRTEKYMDLKE
mgnify:CR=1 FL=1